MVHFDLDALGMMADTAVPRRVHQRLLSKALREGHFKWSVARSFRNCREKGTISRASLPPSLMRVNLLRSGDALVAYWAYGYHVGCGVTSTLRDRGLLRAGRALVLVHGPGGRALPSVGR